MHVQTVSGLFRRGPFSSREGFFYVQSNYLIKGDFMKMLLSTLLVRSHDTEKKPDSLGI
jgi:hypothetical protein